MESPDDPSKKEPGKVTRISMRHGPISDCTFGPVLSEGRF